ncbi:MAG: esterase [Gordonia sp. (in: high G+C Gram-positive bacteria)]|nr:MAG: esterase [Gordonia sp. (in: high G+C Gram-positive bacteria)]
MSFLLVHGAGMSATCWDRLTPLLAGRVVAVDLPGRGTRAGQDLRTVTLDDCAAAILDDVRDADLEDITVVAHSFAGVSVPRVLAQLTGRIRHVVFLSAVVPADGTRVIDGIDPGVREAVQQSIDGGLYQQNPAAVPAMLCNDMTDEQTEWTLAQLVDDAAALLSEPVDLAGLKEDVPRTYIRLSQDACYTPELQAQSAALVGGETLHLDSGHMAMISIPETLANTLNHIG